MTVRPNFPFRESRDCPFCGDKGMLSIEKRYIPEIKLLSCDCTICGGEWFEKPKEQVS